jgi:hypothetical protein
MIFKIEPTKDELVESAYMEGMEELKKFWGINWIKSTPNIVIVKNRADLDAYMGRKTENWLVGAGYGSKGLRGVVVLDYKNINQESINKYDEEGYKALIKHELCHLFFSIASNGVIGPSWLSEGISIYTSGQNDLKVWPKPAKFVGFLEANKEHMMKAYSEGGVVVELLVNKFGKDKILELVKALPGLAKYENFLEKFKEIYGFELTYEKINGIYLENK